MSIDLAGTGAACAAIAAAVGSLARPLFRYLTEKRYVERANPKDLPTIAKALHPRIEVGRARQSTDVPDHAPKSPADRDARRPDD